MNRFRLLLPLLPALLLAACSDKPAAPATGFTDGPAPLNPARDFQPASGDAGVGDIARFLAGRPVEKGEALARWQMTSGDYHTHALEFDFLWRKFGYRRSLRQSQYYDAALRPLLGSPSTIVYPFGGPDILYASSLFPRASTYVLLGLEKTGGVPDVLSQNPNAFIGHLIGVMESPLRYGYYITEQMRKAPDATPILLASLGLMGADVQSVTPFSAAGRSAVEIRFRQTFGGTKRVIYVSADLSNSGFDASLAGWLNQFSGATAYFKAASYLPHDSSFTSVRSWVLENCRSVLQDDSGIPYRLFDSQKWDVTLLGSYIAPIPLFSEHFQPELASAYAAIGGRGPEIPFGSGYHLRIVDANYQVAVRR